MVGLVNYFGIPLNLCLVLGMDICNYRVLTVLIMLEMGFFK